MIKKRQLSWFMPAKQAF